MKIKRRLSHQEKCVLKYLAQGDDEIAFQLCISANTVKTYIQRIFNKLNVRNRTQAVVVALKEDFLRPEDMIIEV